MEERSLALPLINTSLSTSQNKRTLKYYQHPYHRETVSNPNHIQHSLIREAVRKTGVTGGVSITVTSDVPSHGCRLGSSSALTVGLLNALYAHREIEMPLEILAQQGCEKVVSSSNRGIPMKLIIPTAGNSTQLRAHTVDPAKMLIHLVCPPHLITAILPVFFRSSNSIT